MKESQRRRQEARRLRLHLRRVGVTIAPGTRDERKRVLRILNDHADARDLARAVAAAPPLDMRPRLRKKSE